MRAHRATGTFPADQRQDEHDLATIALFQYVTELMWPATTVKPNSQIPRASVT